VIAGAANEIAVMANAVTQMTQDLRLSTVGTGAVEAIVEETLVLADIIEVPELVAKHPTRRRHRQGEPPRRAGRVRSDYDQHAIDLRTGGSLPGCTGRAFSEEPVFNHLMLETDLKAGTKRLVD
jgi:hypothetical protein